MTVEGTVRCEANNVPLSPISFLERSALVYSDSTSVIYGDLRFTWSHTLERCKRLGSALVQLGVSYGDVVAAFLPNTPPMYELHFGVPMAGAVLCSLNIRHDSTMVSVLLRHSEAKLVFVDRQFLDVVKGAVDILSKTSSNLPRIVLVVDPHQSTDTTNAGLGYESLLSMGKPEGFQVRRPRDELDPISLNYTSGTTSSPKGVVYSHRGAYLNSLAVILLNQMGGPQRSVYLWTVPMFHCNGWCLTWAMAALGGTSVCLRAVSPDGIFDSISRHGVTNMGGAPTVLNMIVNAPQKKPLPGKVSVMVGGAPPPSQVILKMEELGFRVTHSYGLTETYGPGTVCTQKPEWESLPSDERARMNARQGLNHVAMEGVDVKDPATMRSVAWDAKTIGEVMLRGNTVMNGYLKDEKATLEAFKGGWFRTGDLGVRHPDGYVELKDRSKDVIISGGENISSIEVESVLFKHPAVLEAAVVGRPDEHWGETPCAFVQLKNGCSVSAAELIGFCRDRLPHYMVPRSVVFDELPKTSTGKTQKIVLKERARAMGSLSKSGQSKL